MKFLIVQNKSLAMKNFLRLILIAVAVPFFLSCNNSEIKVVLLHTNDVHGEIQNFARVAALKQELLTKYDTVFLLSAGDMFSGNPYVDYYNDKGFPMIDLMNLAGYDLATLGNHEFDYGQQVLKKRMDQANFSFLGANIDASEIEFSEKLISSYQFPYKDLTLEFYGLIETGNNGKPSTHPAKVEGIKFTNPLEEIKHIKKSESADYAIMLNHLGYFTDSLIATEHPEFAVIIGGHSHTLIDSLNLINGVLVAQTGSNLENIGMITLTFKNNKLINKEYKLIDLGTYEKENEDIRKTTSEYLSNPDLDTSIGKVLSPFENVFEIGCLLSDAQTKTHNLDFAVQNYYGIRIKSIPVGDFKIALAYEADPFGNELMVYNLSAKEFKSLLANAYKSSRRKDLLISGGSYTIIVDKNEDLIDIDIRDNNGNTLNPNKTYTVGLNSYVSNSYEFDHKDQGTGTSTTTAENLIEYIKSVKELDYNGCKRISIEQR